MPVFPANFNSAGKLAGQTDSVISSYNAVAALRKVDRTNPSLSGGGKPKAETSQIGSFKTRGDGRLAICHFMTLVEKKQNISFSFDPKTLICSSCSGRGGHPVGVYTGGLISHIPPYIHAWRTFSPSHIYLYTFSIDTNQVSSLSLSLLSGADCKQQIINIMGSF